jgi:DNA-directed RNA polymerase subunit alpha
MGQLDELRSFRNKGEEPKADVQVQDSTAHAHPDEDYLSIPIEDIKLSSHTVNALLRGGFKTLGDIVGKTEKELRLLDGVGEKAIQEIHRELGNFGLVLSKE